jgi:hypothetical protein
VQPTASIKKPAASRPRSPRTSGDVTESYSYDGEDERVGKTVSGTPPVTTVYFQGIWEQIVGGASTRYYTFNGLAIAVRHSATNAVTYLHGDYLGSVSLATNSSGAVVRVESLDAASLLCRDFFHPHKR